MFDRENHAHCPSDGEMSAYINDPLWDDLCGYMAETYRAEPKFEFSRCSWEAGWNIKFKKGGRALCTVYPRENYFTVMVVIGRKEKVALERELPTFCDEIQQIYRETKEGNGQRWLMIDLEDEDAKYSDVKRLLELRLR